ncbi:MAG: CoA transferase, family protein [Ilumatobacteraceae bacterium]|nr:CoA transferase, family protein [Ilumatobacteraceae bacterium]
MDDRALLQDLWTDLAGPPDLLDRVTLTGPGSVLPSVYDVTGFATASVAAAVLAVAELAAARSGGAAVADVAVDRLGASASFRFEGLLEAVGWQLPPIWDPVAGDYRAADGWIRLHTNYRHHLDAALAVLGAPAEREAVAAEVARWTADELEAAVVAAGGCAAAMRTVDEWSAHPAGRATAAERPVVIGAPVPISGGTGPDLGRPDGAAPLAGIRVLDLTRVIAGPVATRFLAGYGADVLRIDPPGFEEVPALLPEAPAGKRTAFADLTSDRGRAVFEALVAEAHVVVGGFRPGALAGLGYGPAGLRSINPSLVTVTHDAYGWSGPWAGRRGFDSLVQMSTGIAAAGAAAAGTDRPSPLPAQALDHGIGHLLAAATCRALTRLIRDGAAADVRGSLVGAANVVKASPAIDGDVPTVTVADAPLEDGTTAWGPVRRVPLAGRIHGIAPAWSIDAGPLGRHPAAFATSAAR